MTQAEANPNRTFSASWQSREIEETFQTLKAGESLGLIGVGSMGKSNILRQLSEPAVKAEYLRNAAQYMIVVYLDPHLMIHLSEQTEQIVGKEWSGYELMLSRLFLTVTDPSHQKLIPAEEGLTNYIKGQHRKLMEIRAIVAQLGARHLEASIRQILNMGTEWSVVFLFDEIEEFVHKLPAEFFQTLRGIRDNFKRKLMFVYTARAAVEDLVPAADENDEGRVIESFVELFHERARYLSLLDAQSAQETLNEVARRNGIREWPNLKLFESLFELTGGHPGLLRRAMVESAKYTAAERGRFDTLGLQAYLTKTQPIRKECTIILRSLPDQERQLVERMWKFSQQYPTEEYTLNEVDTSLYELLEKKHVFKMQLFWATLPYILPSSD